MVLGLTATSLATHHLLRISRETEAARLERRAQQALHAISERLERYNSALETLAEYLAARPDLAAAEWRFRMAALWPEQRYPGLLEIGSALAHPESNASDQPRFNLQHGWVRPPSVFDGLDPGFLDQPAQRAAAAAALELGQPRASPPGTLSAEFAGNPAQGFTLYVPIQRQPTQSVDGPQSQPTQHDASGPRGVVFGSIAPAVFFERLFGTASQEIELEIADVLPFQLHVQSAPAARTSPPQPTREGLPPRPYTLQVYGRTWHVTIRPTALFTRESTQHRPWLIAALGLTSSVLVSLLLAVQIRARLRLEVIAAELRHACSDLQAAHAEREHLQRDLHDGAVQSLYGLQLSLGRCERFLDRSPAEARSLLTHCRAMADSLIAELRAFLVNCSSSRAKAKPQPAAEVLAAATQRLPDTGLAPIQLEVAPEANVNLPPSLALQIRQIVHEALSNSLRHAHASRTTLQWTRNGDSFLCIIADNGCGFDLSSVSDTHLGLGNLKARASEIGAQLNLESQPGRGTRVCLALPASTLLPERD